MSLDRNIRDPKTSQVMASNGLVFYEVSSSGDWDFNLNSYAVMVGRKNNRLLVCAVCYYGDNKDKTFLLQLI